VERLVAERGEVRPAAEDQGVRRRPPDDLDEPVVVEVKEREHAAAHDLGLVLATRPLEVLRGVAQVHVENPVVHAVDLEKLGDERQARGRLQEREVPEVRHDDQ
jgi:hypothetical protein